MNKNSITARNIASMKTVAGGRGSPTLSLKEAVSLRTAIDVLNHHGFERTADTLGILLVRLGSN